MNKLLLLLLIINISWQKETRDEARTCLKKATSASCKDLYGYCFDNLECTNQFEDLFGDCTIQAGTEIYENNCILGSYIQISNTLLTQLFDCLAKECNILEGKMINNIAKQQLRPCLQDALLDSSKCWLKTRECDGDCLQAMDVLEVSYHVNIKECEEGINENDFVKVKDCFESKNISNEVALSITECMLSECI